MLHRCMRITTCLELLLVMDARCIEQEVAWMFKDEVTLCSVGVLLRHGWFCSFDQANCSLCRVNDSQEWF